MGDILGPIILGILIIIIGFTNMKGNISSLHWYHRKRVTEENRLPFGRMIGLGTIICGVSIVIYGGLSFAALQTQMEIFTIMGSVITIFGVGAGLIISFYAMIKYNKGIF